MSGIGYTAEVLNLSPNASEKDVHDFFAHCGVLEHVEIVRSGGHPCSAYVTFRDAYALETAVLLTGATIVDQCVAIIRHGQYEDDFDIWDRPQWKNDNGSGSMHADHFVSSPGEAVTLAQTVVRTMVVKGYVLSKDAYSKARAFDESYKVSAQAAAKIAELSKRIGLTDKVYAGMETVKSVDQQYHVSDATKYVGRTTSAAATAFVNSSYFAKGALLVSDVLTKAAKVAADLGSHGKKSEV